MDLVYLLCREQESADSSRPSNVAGTTIELDDWLQFWSDDFDVGAPRNFAHWLQTVRSVRIDTHSSARNL